MTIHRLRLQMNSKSTANRLLLLACCLATAHSATGQIDRYPLPVFPSIANRARLVGAVQLELESENGELQDYKTLSFEFHETRRREPGEEPQQRRVPAYPKVFREAVETALGKWRLPEQALTFRLEIEFRLTDAERISDSDDDSGAEVFLGQPVAQQEEYHYLVQYQLVEGEVLIPGKIIVSASRIGPDIHVDYDPHKESPESSRPAALWAPALGSDPNKPMYISYLR